jgi:ubiquinone/menaquinone biosynthesis C-methylase UbiE
MKEAEIRTTERLRAHFEIEVELAARLRNATKEQRTTLYSVVYDELFRRLPDHPQLTDKSSAGGSSRDISTQLQTLMPLLRRDSTFLEIGPGDCALSFEIAKHVKQVYAVDVSDEITKTSAMPQNFKLALSDGCTIPVPDNSIDLAFSDQLMEHLHPDDALEQLKNIRRALAPGGVYVCITPSRLDGPHDISKYFEPAARGFHLKEYTIEELNLLFKKVGFSKVRQLIGGKGKFLRVQVLPSIMCERLLAIFPYGVRKFLATKFPFRIMLSIRIMGFK